jgi:hypothetical protein
MGYLQQTKNTCNISKPFGLPNTGESNAVPGLYDASYIMAKVTSSSFSVRVDASNYEEAQLRPKLPIHAIELAWKIVQVIGVDQIYVTSVDLLGNGRCCGEAHYRTPIKSHMTYTDHSKDSSYTSFNTARTCSRDLFQEAIFPKRSVKQ